MGGGGHISEKNDPYKIFFGISNFRDLGVFDLVELAHPSSLLSWCTSASDVREELSGRLQHSQTTNIMQYHPNYTSSAPGTARDGWGRPGTVRDTRGQLAFSYSQNQRFWYQNTPSSPYKHAKHIVLRRVAFILIIVWLHEWAVPFNLAHCPKGRTADERESGIHLEKPYLKPIYPARCTDTGRTS